MNPADVALVSGPRAAFNYQPHMLDELAGPTKKSSATPGSGSCTSPARAERWDHVFASVQSLPSYGVTNIPADTDDIVVIDEFHHARAPTYRRLLDHLTPRELLGLTATPERADGIDVRAEYFDGRTATELRRWDALGKDLLCPFRYFAAGIELPGILRRGQRSWTQLRRDAGLPTSDGTPREGELLERIRAFAHVDDELRAAGYRQLLSSDTPYADLTEAGQRLARMLFFSAFPSAAGFST